MFTVGKCKNATHEENNPNFTYTVLGSKQNNSRLEGNLGIIISSSTKTSAQSSLVVKKPNRKLEVQTPSLQFYSSLEVDFLSSRIHQMDLHCA